MAETTVSDAVLARLEALEAEIAGLKVQTAGLEAENVRLTAALATPAGAAPRPVPATTSRRGMLRRVLGASAAAALLLVAKEAGTAEATANVSVVGPSTDQYGIVATIGAPMTAVMIPPLGTTAHSVIGSQIGADAPAFFIPTLNSGVLGVRSSAGAAGVQGINDAGPGVFGRSNTAIGVRAESTHATGVSGTSTNSIGVHGRSTNNAGVFAEGPIGVFATGTGVAGIFGGSSGNGFGFWGNSVASAGIYGTSTTGPGVRAESTNAFGLHAKGPTYAGVFEGNVFVTGRVIAQGGVGASATATGTTRTLAEDVGEATLVNGKATVALAQDFADEIKGGQYQVFVTPHDASGRPLAVVARRRDGFDVQELAGRATDAGTTSGRGSNAGFSYRVVAKLTGPAGPRQAPLAPPDLTTIKPAPPLPEPPKAPEPSGAPEERRER